MEKQNPVRFLGVLFVCVVFCYSQAMAALSPNWNIGDSESQVRQLTGDYSGTSSVIGGASTVGNATNNTLVINGFTVSTEDNVKDAYNNGTDVLIGGAVYDRTASNNKVVINTGSTIQGRTVIGGAALLDSVDHRLSTGTASNNMVSITGSNIIESSEIPPAGSGIRTGGTVVGGYANYGNGTANANTVILDGTNVDNDVYGGYVNTVLVPDVDYDSETGDLKVELNYQANYNTVRIENGSAVSGDVIGSYGAESVTGTTVIVDNSTVANVYGGSNSLVLWQGEGEVVSKATDNTVKIQNGSTVNNACAITGVSTEAVGNKLIVDNSTVSSGELRAAAMGLFLRGEEKTPINANISANAVELSNMAAGSLLEIGAGLNMAGTSNENTTTLKNLAGLTVYRPGASFGVLDIGALDTQKLFGLKNLTATAVVSTNNFKSGRGFIYGGTALDYTSQTNNPLSGASEAPDEAKVANGGNQANGNSVYIADSTVEANVIGGFAGQIKEVNYATWSGDSSSGYTETYVHKDGNNIVTDTYQCTGIGSGCTQTGSDSQKEEGFKDQEFSANNNTVILENTNFNGVVYGGYVIGADLNVGNVSTSNNRVILRGNTTLDANAKLYGGNAFLGATTNKLVFDHVSAGGGAYSSFSKSEQFQNFDPVWEVQADLDTRINFDFNNVQALVSVDATTAEGTAAIIKTKTTADLSGVDQNGISVDLLESNISLAHGRKGIYSYTITPEVDTAPNTVKWVLNVARDHNNVEVYGQLPLVGLALATEGTDMLRDSLSEAWQSDMSSNAFFSGGAHHTRYHTGSGIDLNSGLMQAGFWKKMTDSLLGGFFVKYSVGNYKTYPIKATGDANAFGGGLMTSMQYSETGRFEASVEVGQLDMEFKSDELISTMKSDGIYYGATAGVVENILPTWELFANLKYLRKNGDSITDNLGQSVRYEALQSIALHAGTEVSFPDAKWKGLTPSVGVSAIYEFDGESKVNVLGSSNNEASMKGLSGRGQLGLTYASEDPFLPVVSKLMVFGQAGIRSGFGGEASISFQF